jgi:adenine-specific DNA-methyltransferase
MMRGKLELNWVDKYNNKKIEPRILIEDRKKSYGDTKASNMLINGDNLLGLKALEKDFEGQIKCVYIDPPYNTGHAFEQYDDGIEHSIWLNLMRQRLQIIYNLLSNEGSLWISIDDDEGHYLKVICDEIFGRKNFINTVIWHKKHTRSNDARFFSDNHDFILVYAKNKESFKLNLLPRTEEQNKGYTNPDNDSRGPWASGPCHVKTPNPKDIYEVKTPSGKTYWPPAGTSWRFSKEKFQSLVEDNRIWFGENGGNVPRFKRFLSDVQQGIVPTTIWFRDEVGDNQEAKTEAKHIDKNNVFATPKPERLVQRILELATTEGDWVLDSFAGSGTTGAVAHKMKRKWIMIELNETSDTHCLPRLKKIIDGKDENGITKEVNWSGGGGFRYFNIADSFLVKHPVLNTYVINPSYSDEMVKEAVCKIEGYEIIKDGLLTGKSSEKHYSHVTTKMVNNEYIQMLLEAIRDDESLTIYCIRKSSRIQLPDNIEIKRIPFDIIEKYDFGVEE